MFGRRCFQSITIICRLRTVCNTFKNCFSTKVWNLDAMREAVVFGRRITAPEAKTLSLVDSVVELDKLIPEAKRLAKHALGNNDIDRNALTMMKSNTYVRKILSSKL